MFGVPILMTLLFAFLFGGVGGSDSEFTVPKTTVQIVNLDQGSEFIPSFEFENQIVGSLGEMLVSILQKDNFSDLMALSLADEAAARSAVDAREIGLAIIIPANFTDALIGMTDEPAAIEFYKDPELTLGPQITKSIVMSVVDGFSSGVISMDAILQGLSEQDVELSSAQQAQLIQTLTQEGESNGRSQSSALKFLPPPTPHRANPPTFADHPSQHHGRHDDLLCLLYRGFRGADHPAGTGKRDAGKIIHLPNAHPDHPERQVSGGFPDDHCPGHHPADLWPPYLPD